jgi:arylsulfatase A-like enzyme
MSVAVVSTASAGTTHLLNPRAREQGQVSLCLTDWRASTPAAYAQTLLERHGAIPPKAMPNAARAERQTDMVLDSVLPDVAPDVLMVWYSDPDLTYHYRGIGSPESLAAIRTVDAQFGRILDYCARSPDAERCQVIACSDHGLVTARERIQVAPLMRAAGLPVGEAFTEGNTLAGSTGYSGALRVAEHDETGMQRAVSWLIEQPWCGPVFTPGGNGILGGVPATLDLALLSLQHPRTPQVYYAMAADDTANAWGLPGSCYFNAEDIKPGGGTHGGLHPIEMNNLLAAGGAAFRSRYVSPWPASHTDIVPTLLGLLGIAAPETVTGRALTEALRRAGAEPPAPQTLACVSEAGGRRQRLDVWRVGKTAYIDRGWVEQA